MDLLIKKNEQTIYTSDYGLKLLKFRPQSVSHNHQLESIDLYDGAIRTGSTFGSREIQVSFSTEKSTHILLELLKSELNALFATKEEVTLIDSRQPGKQWRAVVNSTFDIEYINPRTGRFDLTFLSPSTYCQSVGSTLDDFTFAEDKWQAGMNIPADENLFYKHVTNRFKIYNAGVYLDPSKLPLRIIYTGASNNLVIKNMTTGDVFAYYGTSDAGDQIILDRINHYKNSTNIFSYTNHKRISLATGWNDFEIYGASNSFSIQFDFKFYYI